MKGGVVRERKKADERGRPPLYIYIPWYCPLTLPPLFQFFFPVSFFSLFVPSLLPVHLEKASPQSTLYSAAAPARALAGILL